MQFRLSILLLLLLSAAAHGQAEFRYFVDDWTANKNLDVDHLHDVTIYNFAGSAPRLSFYTRLDIYGCRQDSFTYTVQSCALNLPVARYNKFLAAIRAFPLETLQKKMPDDPEHRSHGWVEIDGRQHQIATLLTETQRAAFHALVISFLDDVAPRAKRIFTTRTIEGDFIPARALTFETLLKNPKKFDGKRVRLTGYYHDEFEGSNFGPNKRAGYKESVWLNGDSSFATAADVKRPNDTFITVDGTFNIGPGGHMGLWPGDVARVTRIKKPKP